MYLAYRSMLTAYPLLVHVLVLRRLTLRFGWGETSFMYTGRVDTLPCSVRNYVFTDIDFTQADQIVCGTNEEWSEVWWFYPSESGGTNWNDRYVIYNYQDRIWYYGNIQRTAWLDAPNREFPIAAGSGRNDFIY